MAISIRKRVTYDRLCVAVVQWCGRDCMINNISLYHLVLCLTCVIIPAWQSFEGFTLGLSLIKM